MNRSIIKYCIGLFIIGALGSCNDFLEREPLSDVTPDDFFTDEGDLETYTVSLYDFPSHGGYGVGTFGDDNGSDNQATVDANNRWAPGELRVGSSGGAWGFDKIRDINYFLNIVEERLGDDEITGDPVNIDHYLGEGYFLRAYEYFNKLKALGDFPILKKTLPDKMDTLIVASQRRPRNEVARFILEDLDEAIDLLKPGSVDGKNRISRDVALLFKSRVALFEGTWEKYHSGTSFVPGNSDWPGSDAEYLKDYSIELDSEINFFLSEAMTAAEEVAEEYVLTPNNHPGDFSSAAIFDNPYFEMFSDTDMSNYEEVLLWRQYNDDYISHYNQAYLGANGGSTGYTKSLVASFLMKNGLPIYAAQSGYKGDKNLENVRKNRDERLQMFMKINGDDLERNEAKEEINDYPKITETREERSVTGYDIKKGLTGNSEYYPSGNASTSGSVVFRATEAYLNYIEANYVKDESLDGVALSYWKELRARAGLPDDPNVTIAATDLSKEKDLGKYSKGELVDKTLYNIRRERRNEFIAEGMRMDDLKRWRALDQMDNYIVEGFNLWDNMYKEYEGLRYEPESEPNVSPKENGKYLRPYQIVSSNNKFYDGYNWTPAHYLDPIAFKHFLLTSDGDPENSNIYQNPYWPVESGGTPQNN